jgi:thioredoxin-like negative regulator of GroEL
VAEQPDDEDALRRALSLDPRHTAAATALARLLIARGDYDDAAQVLAPFPSDFVATGLAARARLARDRDDLDDAWSAWDGGDHEAALEKLQEAFVAAEGDDRDALRQAMVAIFTELGPDSELARTHRRRMASAMY